MQTINTHFWDHSRFMPDFWEKAVSISCCCAVRVGTGLDEGVGAGATKARRISSVVAILIKSWSLTMHKLRGRRGDDQQDLKKQHILHRNGIEFNTHRPNIFLFVFPTRSDWLEQDEKHGSCLQEHRRKNSINS